MSELEPLDDDILALIAKAKHVPELEGAQKAGILAKAEARIGGGGGGGGGDTGGSPRSGTGTGTGTGTFGKVGLAMTLGVGIVVGIAMDRLWTKNDGVASVVVAASAQVTPDAGARVAEVVSVSPASLPDAPRASASAHASGSVDVPSSRGLAAERGLLDVARSALARGEAGEALVATTRHARDYPDGALVEEREAIAIKALVALGRKDEARTRARAHEQRFPNGLTLRAVKAAVEGAP